MTDNKPMFPGALDLTNEEYHGDTSRISKSGTDKIDKSPAHYYAKYLDPDREPEEETDALRFGKAAHVAVFESHLFDRLYIASPGFDRRTKVGKADAEKFAMDNVGKIIIDPTEFDRVRRMQAAVLKHPVAGQLVESCFAEQSFHFTDPESGAPCKFRPDGLPNIAPLIADLKTTEDAAPSAFARSVIKYRYHVQAALYLDGMEIATGWRPEAFVFIAAEKKPPYAVACYYLEPDDIIIGRVAYQQNLLTYAECLRTGHWPAYSDEITRLRLPAWKSL